MFRFFQNTKRSLDSLFNLITDLVADRLLFFRLLFRSRTSQSSEVLFLRKQPAFYEERQVQPRRLDDSARVCLILWSRICNWKEALVIVKPETLIGWHRKGFQAVSAPNDTCRRTPSVVSTMALMAASKIRPALSLTSPRSPTLCLDIVAAIQHVMPGKRPRVEPIRSDPCSPYLANTLVKPLSRFRCSKSVRISAAFW
jgi:hypothetical protein